MGRPAYSRVYASQRYGGQFVQIGERFLKLDWWLPRLPNVSRARGAAKWIKRSMESREIAGLACRQREGQRSRTSICGSVLTRRHVRSCIVFLRDNDRNMCRTCGTARMSRSEVRRNAHESVDEEEEEEEVEEEEARVSWAVGKRLGL